MSDTPGSAAQPPLSGWTVLSRRCLVADRWLTLHADRVRTANGAELDPFYVIDERSWACVIPVLPDGRLVLVEQYRHGAQRVMLELPAGDLDAGEQPAAAALRELAEETGHRAIGEPVPLGALFPEPARNRSCGHGYVVAVAATAGERHLDAGEQIRVHRCTVDEAFAALAEGRIAHAVHAAFLHQARAAGFIG